MGNKQGTDYIAMPINGGVLIENDIDFETAKKHGISRMINVQDNPTEKKLDDIVDDVIKKMKESSDQSHVFDGYDKETILNIFGHSRIIDIMNNEKNLVKAKQMATLLPKSDRPLIFNYWNIPIEVLELMLPSLKCDVIVDGKTFLFEDCMYIKRINQLLSQNIKIDVNIEVTTNTFLELMILRKQINYERDDLTTLFTLLKKYKYNFNHLLSFNKFSFFTTMIYYSGDEYLYKLASIEEFDISIDSEWVRYLVSNTKLRLLHNILCMIFQRCDYQCLFIKLYRNLHIHIWDDEFIVFCKKAYTSDNEKTIECLKYEDKDGNTLFHHMAIAHDKNTLQFAYTYFGKDYFDILNNDGKSVNDLFKLSKFPY